MDIGLQRINRMGWIRKDREWKEKNGSCFGYSNLTCAGYRGLCVVSGRVRGKLQEMLYGAGLLVTYSFMDDKFTDNELYRDILLDRWT